MNGAIRHLLFVVVMVLYPLSTFAAEKVVQFSAQAVQTMPNRPEMVANMYVGKNAVRTDYTANGQKVIEIVYLDQKRRVMILPDQSSYMEKIDESVPSIDAGNKNINPCAGLNGITCKKLGTENVNGRNAVKWEMTSKQNTGREVKTLHWIDVERNMPVKEFFQDGTVSELRNIKNEKVNGRNTEKWELIISSPDGNKTKSYQWYDPALKIEIREEMPGGYVRELRNIKQENQSAKLFEIPSSYKKVTQPPANQMQQRR
jgi:hypothetical protein